MMKKKGTRKQADDLKELYAKMSASWDSYVDREEAKEKIKEASKARFYIVINAIWAACIISVTGLIGAVWGVEGYKIVAFVFAAFVVLCLVVVFIIGLYREARNQMVIWG